jgi:hypothetical protein
MLLPKIRLIATGAAQNLLVSRLRRNQTGAAGEAADRLEAIINLCLPVEQYRVIDKRGLPCGTFSVHIDGTDMLELPPVDNPVIIAKDMQLSQFDLELSIFQATGAQRGNIAGAPDRYKEQLGTIILDYCRRLRYPDHDWKNNGFFPATCNKCGAIRNGNEPKSCGKP